MTHLEKIQKAVKVLKILARIAAVFVFIGAAFALVGSITLFIPGLSGLKSLLFDPVTLVANINSAQFRGLLLSLAFCLAMDGALLLYAVHCLRLELAEGTPFTKAGADRAKNLGVWSIVVALLSAVAESFVDIAENLEGETFDNAGGIVIGICLILFSLILRYGAELESEKKIEKIEEK